MRSYVKANLVQKQWVKTRVEVLARTAVGLFQRDPKVRGAVTLDKAVAFRLLDDLAKWRGMEAPFVRMWADKTGLSINEVRKIVSETAHRDVAVSVKMKHGLAFDVKIRKARFGLDRASFSKTD